MRVLITGGGTGGHLYPALSVAGLLQELDNRCQILFVGTGEGLESRVVPERGYSFRQITAGKWPRKISFNGIRDLISWPRQQQSLRWSLFYHEHLLQLYPDSYP